MTIEATLRVAGLEDVPEIIRLYAQTVLTVCQDDYESDQLRVWARRGRDPIRWEQRISNQFFIVAEICACLAGFASLTNENYLDVFYISKDHQRRGLASLLFEKLHRKALENGIPVIRSDVSRTARPYFEKLGFRVVREQENSIDGVTILNYRMEMYI